MGSDRNGGACDIPPEQRLNLYALVIYIPGPLGQFLDDLRRELVPDYNPHAHVSVLPPRPLSTDWTTASEQVRAEIEAWEPFRVELTDLHVFPVTDVLYLEVGAGAEQLRQLNAVMNARALEFREPFPYHPHITLAQEVPSQDVPALDALARARWQEYRGERWFRADRAVFVQNTMNDVWIDLAEYSLGALAVR
jgi:2'-5' RNA ligase